MKKSQSIIEYLLLFVVIASAIFLILKNSDKMNNKFEHLQEKAVAVIEQ